MSTDQVRFARAGEAVPLPEVPPLVFSEVLRDVDLFVGVGNVLVARGSGQALIQRPGGESSAPVILVLPPARP